jgi:hypothetical protein
MASTAGLSFHRLSPSDCQPSIKHLNHLYTAALPMALLMVLLNMSCVRTSSPVIHETDFGAFHVLYMLMSMYVTMNLCPCLPYISEHDQIQTHTHTSRAYCIVQQLLKKFTNFFTLPHTSSQKQHTDNEKMYCFQQKVICLFKVQVFDFLLSYIWARQLLAGDYK